MKFVGIATDLMREFPLPRFLELHAPGFPILQDEGRSTYDLYDRFVKSRVPAPFPRHYVVNPRGWLVYAAGQYYPGAMEAVIEEMLDDEPGGPPGDRQ